MSFLAQHTGFLLNDLLKGYRVGPYFREFKHHITLDQATLRELQFNKLIQLLEHAYNFSPFYRDRLKSFGSIPDDFKTLEQLQKIPPLTRDDLQNHWEEIITTNIDKSKLQKGSSSGSTGVPVVYFKDNKASSAGQAAGYLCWSLAGWRLGMKGLHIWGNPVTVEKEWSRNSSKLKAWFLNHYKFPAYQLTDENKIKELAEYVRSANFEFIDGYTNSIYILADYIKQKGKPLKKPLKMVLTTAENLHDYQRNIIEEVLGPVYDLYGCSEINGIAGECKICGKYHVMDTHVLVEYGQVVDEFQNKELIITDLDNYAFPMIRYLNNDIGNRYEGDKPCSVPFSRMGQLSGRQSDIIKLPDGGTLSVPSFFGSMLLKKINGIIKYQIEKDRPDHLLIKFVVSTSFTEKDREVVKQSMDQYLGERIKWDIAIVDDIPVSQTGKFKLVIDSTK